MDVKCKSNFRKENQMELNFIKDYIAKELHDITWNAQKQTTCKRKGVGCSIIEISQDSIVKVISTFNGPSNYRFQCTNEIGNCGCAHAEQKAIIGFLKAMRLGDNKSTKIMLCTYSPCTNCANIIIESRVIDGIVYDILTEHDKRGMEMLKKVMDVITLEELKKGNADAILRRWEKSGPESK